MFHFKSNSSQILPSHFTVFLTSPTATLNIATDIWPQYLPGKVKVSFNAQKLTIIKYDRAIEYTFKNGVENSATCIESIIEASECNKCLYFSGSSLPICNSTKDFQCIWPYYKYWQKCLLQLHPVAYVPQLNEVPIFDPNISASGVFIISAASETKQIIEEIEVITLAGLIGSIGGSLGMFFGFSITSYLALAIEKLVKSVCNNNP